MVVMVVVVVVVVCVLITEIVAFTKLILTLTNSSTLDKYFYLVTLYSSFNLMFNGTHARAYTTRTHTDRSATRVLQFNIV